MNYFKTKKGSGSTGVSPYRGFGHGKKSGQNYGRSLSE